MKDLKDLKKLANKKFATIILPEANIDERIRQACIRLLKEGTTKLIVFGAIDGMTKEFLSDKCEIINIESDPRLEDFATQLYELRKHKGMTIDEAKELIKTPEYFSMLLLKNDYADGLVAGAKWTTANTLRPALQVIKCKKGKSSVVGSMLMLKKGMDPLVYTDVSLIENPDSEQLAEIAISGAEFMDKVVGNEPKVALLSYSTYGSAKSEMVDKVKNATEIAKSKSTYLIDGEMQGDSALEMETAKKKCPTSKVAGQANVLVFPELDAGNIAYKLTAYFGGVQAVGPIMLNFAKPINDLSRGSTVEEIINTVYITKLMCENK
ncbi:MAG: phosphotransacetylase [Clostridia bacterium]|nr:phosphotransacetylase [Clostridia bacterium]